MERRERYDPEDIESLLTERSFDELLEEERAFVLRHLSGRDEYEQMRALLHYVRPDEGMRTPIEADDRVRVNVMAAFRAQQRPQWQIWLNSLAAWLKPDGPAGFWRPALAFGSLALLIVAGVVAVRQFNGNPGTATLAEVKQVPALAKEEIAPPTAGATDQAAKNQLEATNEAQAAMANEATRAANGGTRDLAEPVRNYELRTDASASAEEADAPSVAPPPVEDMAAALDKDLGSVRSTPTTTVPGSAAPVTGHVVTADELATNQSLANGSDAVKSLGSRSKRSAAKDQLAVEKADKDITVSRSMAEDPTLMGLIARGW